jgi:hypothetical protein
MTSRLVILRHRNALLAGSASMLLSGLVLLLATKVASEGSSATDMAVAVGGLVFALWLISNLVTLALTIHAFRLPTEPALSPENQETLEESIRQLAGAANEMVTLTEQLRTTHTHDIQRFEK